LTRRERPPRRRGTCCKEKNLGTTRKQNGVDLLPRASVLRKKNGRGDAGPIPEKARGRERGKILAHGGK